MTKFIKSVNKPKIVFLWVLSTLLIGFASIFIVEKINSNSGRQISSRANVFHVSRVIHLSDKTFENEISEGIVLVDFWAHWCQPCLIQGPILENLAADSKKDIKVVKVDVEKHSDLANAFQVRSIPTLILFKNGKPVKRMIGIQSQEALAKLIRSYR